VPYQNYEIVSKQIKGFGGMIGFATGRIEVGKMLVNNLKVCVSAT